MSRDALIACLPYLAAIVVSVGVLRLLVWASGARLRLSHVWVLHRDQAGGVQSLSFVLTLPIFAMFLMFIVQMSQLVIAQVMVHYAAFAAARSAIVWIPATDAQQQANHIGSGLVYEGDEGDVAVYAVSPGGEKFDRIQRAAALACMPICPSHDVGFSAAGGTSAALLDALQKCYLDVAPAAASNGRIPDRIANKLGYALANTRIEMRIRHKTAPPDVPLSQYAIPPYLGIPGYGPDYLEEYSPSEVGWHDQVEVQIIHNFALLPGPGRLLARQVSPQTGQATVPSGILQLGQTYAVPLTATVRLQNEGQKSLLPYRQFYATAGP